MKTIRAGGLEQLERAIGNFASIAEPFLIKAMNQITLALVGIVKVYPSATAANRPGRWKDIRLVDKKKGQAYIRVVPMGFYERHKGWWYPVMVPPVAPEGQRLGLSLGTLTARQMRKRFKLHGTGAVGGYKLSKGGASEFLGQSGGAQGAGSWEAEGARREGDAVVGVVGNRASYAPYVIGSKQTPYMRRIGWVGIDTALESQEFAEVVDAAINEATEKIAGAIAATLA